MKKRNQYQQRKANQMLIVIGAILALLSLAVSPWLALAVPFAFMKGLR